jgi:1-acyl-sn-glycerol-3-phosphate acyltransferase
MQTDVKILRLGDMIFNRQGTFFRRVIHAVVSIAVRLFFRRIETVNAAEVPYQGALIFVMNHPNGLIDPALVFVALPRKVSFLAKSTLFKTPGLSYLLRVIEALPVYRKIDSADVAQNAKTFEASHELLRRGGAIAIFPEGISHNSPKLLPIKTGAARIALGALSFSQTDEELDLKIVPVGLFYTSKTTFRSEALLHFGEPFPVEPVELENGELPREAVKNLTEKIENALSEVTLNAETEAAIETADQAANLFLSVSETFDSEETLSARFDFLQKHLKDKKETTEKNPKLEKVTRRISQHKKKLRLIGLEPENLSLSSQPFWYVFQHFLVRVFVLLFFAPLAFAGIILHFPAYQLSKFIAARYTNRGLDDIISTVKILSGILFMPLTWAILAGILYFYFGFRVALASLPLSFLCGYIALRSLEEIEDLRGWFRAVLLFYRKRDLFMELVRERRALHKELKNVVLLVI